ncbi:MAG: YIP1 family protein [Clostridia bacterium]
MFANLLEKIKSPVTTMIEKSQEEDLKKSGIKLAIVSVVMALISTISSIISIFSKYSKKSYWYSYYSSSELWDKRWDAIKNAGLFTGFLKTAVISAIVIAIIALVLFIIAKIVKSPKEYSNNLSMANNTAIIYVVGSILKLIISLIYAPLGLLIWYAVTIYASFTLINAYRDTLEVENTNMLVLATTGILSALMVILVILLTSILKVSFSDISSLLSLLNY